MASFKNSLEFRALNIEFMKVSLIYLYGVALNRENSSR